MRLYKNEIRYCPFTGVKQNSYVESDMYICDYTGEIIDYDDENFSQYTLKARYNHDAEPCYSEDNIITELEDLGIDYWNLMEENEFVFKVYDWYTHDASLLLVKEWVENIDNSDSIFYKCFSIEEAMRYARNRTLIRLLKENIFKKDQLGLEGVNY